jgi:integrase
MAPEFAMPLDEIPAEQRLGHVFLPLNKDALPYAPSRNVIGPIVSAIGEKAGIIIGQRRGKDDDGNPVTLNKYANAHDLRRAFGSRWSRRVMPPVLKELMRHTDIATMMKFHVGVNAQATANELWRVAG